MTRNFFSHNTLRNAFLLGAILMLNACASSEIIDLGFGRSIGSVGSKTTIVIEDKRPASDKEYSVGSFLFTSDDYGIHTIGDNNFKPPTLDALRERLQLKLSKSKRRIKKVNIRLDHLIVQNNMQASMLASGSSQLGPLGVAIAEGMAGKDFERSLDKTRPFILALFKGSISVDGKTRNLNIAKANNYLGLSDGEGKLKAMRQSVTSLLDAIAAEVVSR